MPTIRQARVGEMIKRDLAEILQRDLRDPRLALVSIVGVDVARDFTIAKVFISSIGTPEEKTAALRALQGASGFLRGKLGSVLELRTVPQLIFRYDTGIDRGVRMFELLKVEEVNFPTPTAIAPDSYREKRPETEDEETILAEESDASESDETPDADDETADGKS